MERRLIAALTVSLAAALLVIAFLIGRLSVKPSMGTSPISIAARAEDAPAKTAATVSQVMQHPAPQIPVPDPHTPEASITPEASTTPEAIPYTAVASYFAQIDAIQVEGGSDPTAFAQAMLGGLERGDSSQLDKFVADARLALGRARDLHPPPACNEYHRKLIEAMTESVSGLERFRTSIEKQDMDGVTSVVKQLEGSQQKINDLQSMRKLLLGQ